MTSSTASEFDPSTMGAGQKSLVRVTTLECEISKLIPIVAARLLREGYGKFTQTEIALALSNKARDRLHKMWGG